MASGWGSSKFTVQTVVVRCNSQMSMRRGRSFVASRGCGGEVGRLVDVDCGESAPGRTSMLATTEISSAGFGSGSTYIIYCPNNSTRNSS